MLTQITIQGFKSLQDVRDLALGQVNVFIGANGSGKTNLLEAIGLLGAAVRDPADDEALQRRGVRPGTLGSSFSATGTSEKINAQLIWSEQDVTYHYPVEISRLISISEQLSIHPGSVIWQPTWDRPRPIDTGDDESLAKKYKISPDQHRDRVHRQFGLRRPPFIPQIIQDQHRDRVHSLFGPLSEYAIFSPNTPVLRGTEADSQRLPVGLAGGRLPEAVAELLDVEQGMFGALDLDELLQLLDWVDQIAIVPPSRELVPPSVPAMRNVIRFTDRWMTTDKNQLSAYNASEGALYVLFVLVLALHPRSPRLFAIENWDQAMHPRLARATVRLFCQQMLQADKKRQALLTTHHPLVLDGLDLSDDRIRLFTVERNRQGATRIDRVQVSDEILKATQDGLSLSYLWTTGRLGGAPDIF